LNKPQHISVARL